MLVQERQLIRHEHGIPIHRAPQFFEAGIHYSWNKYPNIEPVDPTMIPVQYTWAKGNNTGTNTIHIYPRDLKHIHRLLNHWTRSGWTYNNPIPPKRI